MEIAFGIFGSLLPLLVLGGIIYLIARLISKRDKTTSEGAGVVIRRLFQYGLMLAMLVLATIGIAGLIDAALSAGSRITRDSEGTALSIAFVFVALPVFTGLAIYTARRLKADAREQQSVGWAAYLTLVLVGSLVTVMSLVGAFLAELLDERSVDRTVLIYTVIWAIVWISHWWVAQRRGYPHRMRVHLLLGSVAGLTATFIGVTAATIAVLSQIYDQLFRTSIVDRGIEPLVASFIVLLVGLPVWWWYWFRHASHLERTPLWLTYVLLLGVLGGAIAVISGAGILTFGVLQWILGDPPSATAAGHFDFIPGAAGSIVGGAAIWMYHTRVLGTRNDRPRSEVDRVYDYLLSGAGLVVAASGVATLITVLLMALAGEGTTSLQSNNATATALTLLVIGTPLWWHYWSAIQSNRRAKPETELRSTTRRIYIFLLFGVAGMVSVVNLIIIVFMVFNDILEGEFGAHTLDIAAAPIALLLTAGVLAWYHAAIYKEDHATVVEEEVALPTLRKAIVIGPDVEHLAATIRSDIGAKATTVKVVSEATTAVSAQDLMDLLRAADCQTVLVIANGEGDFEVIPVVE